MPPRKRTSSVLNGDVDHDVNHVVDHDAEQPDVVEPAPSDQTSALAEALEEAEAEAAEAEAALAVARARARALKLRRQAEAAAAPAKATAAAPVAPPPAEVEEPTAAEEAPAALEPGTAQAALVDADEDDPEDDPDDEPLDIDDEPGRGRRARLPRVRMPRIGPRTLIAALVVLVSVGLLAGSAWMGFQHRQATEQRQRTAELMAAARQGVVTMMSLNFNSAQDDVKRIIDNTTGDFRRDFQGQADEFAKVAQASRVITEATVNATAVQSMTNDGGTVLVAVTTQVSNAASKEQEPRSWRLRVDMARDGGQLKLAKVEFVP
jgi:Mce-associated membrane protein